MADGISLLDIPQAAPAELAAGQFVYVVTPDGTNYKADISEVVERMQEDSGCVCLKSFNIDFTSAEVLAAVSASPVAMGITLPSGQNILIQSILCGMVNDLATPYDTNTTVAVRYVGADEPIFTLDILGMTVTTLVPMVPNTSPSSGNTVFVTNAALEWYVDSGAALNGTGNLIFQITYILV